MAAAAGRRDNDDDGRNDIQELARVIRQSQREPYPKIDVPLFDGNHASSWANKFEQLGYSNEWTDEKMLRMVKRYCQVEYRDEIDELVRISRNWPDFKARLLEKYQLSDRLLDLRDLRTVDRKKFGTTKQFLSEFERVARLIPDLSDKDRCLIFLDNFNDVEQSKLVEGMHGRYDSTKVRQNALVGKFDDILYRLLRQQEEEWENVNLGEVKDDEIYKTLTCMREMMEGVKEERLKLQVMLASEKKSKRKGKESVGEESDSESEEEKDPPRKLTKAERKGKNGGQNNQGGNGNVGAGSSGQSSQDQGQFQPQGGRGRGRGRGNGQRSRWAWQQEATCNYCAEKGHIMRFCQLLSKYEEEGIVFITIRGGIFDYEGNLIDPNIERGMRKEAYRRMGRPLPATFRIASPEEAGLAGVEEVMASLHIDDSSAEPGGFREKVVERAQTIMRRLARCRDSILRLCVDMEEAWPGLPNVFLFGEWGDKREDASGQAGTSAPRETSQTGPMVSTMRPRPVLKRSAPTLAVQTRMRRRNEQLQEEREPEKAVGEKPIPVSESDEDNEDEKLRAEEEERARRRALEREPEKGKTEAGEEEPRKKKNIYSIPVEQGVDIERLVDKILEKADQAEESVTVDAFLKEKESQLSINSLTYLTDAATRRGKSIWNAPTCHEVRSELVMEGPFIEEDPWGEQTAEEMMRLALTDDIDLMLDPLTIEQGHMQTDDAFQTVGRMSYIMNLLVHEERLRLMNAEEGSSEVKEAFKEKEHEGEYKKIRMWLNGELDENEVDPVVREKSKGFVVHDGHLFKKVVDGLPKRVVCETSR
ncbi:hypothetical protein CBR_g12875 [Chara braunii]|uniref:CCHC-type domain-containing protein n=1 Tax=Chara braunii TaxID=69332 RepID=A0A388KSY0_CHABU|nr:hypothetical protein CBR_g12875 [Chara braunii]|eukprot:GBG73157.1 hypothetical protein CBR_g12875 [Chara braunii]